MGNQVHLNTRRAVDGFPQLDQPGSSKRADFCLTVATLLKIERIRQDCQVELQNIGFGCLTPAMKSCRFVSSEPVDVIRSATFERNRRRVSRGRQPPCLRRFRSKRSPGQHSEDTPPIQSKQHEYQRLLLLGKALEEATRIISDW